MSVEVLCATVQETQGQQEQQDPGEAVAHHHQHPQQAEDVGQENVEDEGQRVVDAVQVRGETVEDASQRSDVKEGHCGLDGQTEK